MKILFAQFQRSINPRNRERSSVAMRLFNKALDRVWISPLAGEISDIDSVKIAGLNECVDCLQTDVIGIDVVGSFPAECGHCGVRFSANIVRLTPYHQMFTIGFVPDWVNIDTSSPGPPNRPQLRLSLMSKAVADTERIFLNLQDSPGDELWSSRAEELALPVHQYADVWKLSSQCRIGALSSLLRCGSCRLIGSGNCPIMSQISINLRGHPKASTVSDRNTQSPSALNRVFRDTRCRRLGTAVCDCGRPVASAKFSGAAGSKDLTRQSPLIAPHQS